MKVEVSDVSACLNSGSIVCRCTWRVPRKPWLLMPVYSCQSVLTNVQQSYLRCDGTVSEAPCLETVDHHYREVVLSQRHTDG